MGIENGKFMDVIYDHFKKQIEVIQLKGYELATLNETALKFAGLLNKNDRVLIINNILQLVNAQNTLQCAQSTAKMIDYMTKNDLFTPQYDASLNCNWKAQQNLDVDVKYRRSDCVLDEVMNLWKHNH